MIEPLGLNILELIDPNIQKQELSSTLVKQLSDRGVMHAVFTPGHGIAGPPPPLKLLTCGHVPALSAVPSYEFFRHVNKSSKRFFQRQAIIPVTIGIRAEGGRGRIFFCFVFDIIVAVVLFNK